MEPWEHDWLSTYLNDSDANVLIQVLKLIKFKLKLLSLPNEAFIVLGVLDGSLVNVDLASLVERRNRRLLLLHELCIVISSHCPVIINYEL